MVFAKISDAEKYFGVIQGLDKAVEFIKNASESGLEERRYEISDGIFAFVSTYVTKPEADCRLEAHKNYADVQVLLSGKEKILVRDLPGLKLSEEYSPEKDIEFYEIAEASAIVLNPESFVLLLPEDAHAPGVAADSVESVKKLVVKIKI